jgi:putative hemolysin
MFEWTLIRGVLVAFFILANSFFVAAEFALVSIRETRVQQMIVAGRTGARTLLQLKRNINDFLPAVQFGVTLAALALGWVGEPAVAETLTRLVAQMHLNLPSHAEWYIHGAAVTLAFVLIAYFEVLLGELVPKSLALQRAERIALAVAGPMDVFIRLSRPAIHVMNGSAALVLRLFKAPLQGEGEFSSPEELKLLATATRRMGLLPSFQEEMIHRAVELSHVTVREIMTPRGRIFSLPANLTLAEASARIVEEQHTRVPVFDPLRGPEHIIGIVHSKDVARIMHFRATALAFRPAGEPARVAGPALRDVMREALFVPETKLAVDLLQEFQERRRLMAIVVDEFGSTSGIVSAEDVLEQIVGELEDEFDIGSEVALASAGGGMMLDGTTPLRDLVTSLGWSFPRRAGIETLAGYVLAELGHLPVAGESVLRGGRRFTASEMMGRRISRVLVEDRTGGASEQATEDDGLEVGA